MKAFRSVLSTLVFSSVISGCNQGSSGDSNMVTTNFSMTSSNEVTVASSNYRKFLDALVPTAVALEPINLRDLQNRPVELDSAWIVLKKIQFHASVSSEGNDSSYHYKGPFYVDLLSNEPMKFGDIALPAEGIRSVMMLLHKATNGDVPSIAPGALINNSIYFKGKVNTLNFTFTSDDTTDFSISGTNAVVPEEGKDFLAVIRMADVFKKIDLSDVTEGTNISSVNRVTTTSNDPCPEIHAQANDLYTCFKKGIALSAKLGKDNGDKDLNSSDEIVNE